MKKFFRNLMLFGVATAMFAACGDEPEVTKRDSDSKTNTSLELSKTELTFAKIAESKSVAITTSESWLAETPADWVTISPLAGNGTGSITISVTENMQNTVRESYVKISTKSDEKMVVVVQSGDTNNGGENGNENGGDNQQGNVTIENGAIKAAFSVSNSKQVYFSQGNLQYQASTSTWRFAENQYDISGDANDNISNTYNGWIDLFGWGTSGYNGKYPYMSSEEDSDYYSNDIDGTNYDWGVYNKISNGGNQAGIWRTLTYREWDYVINGRTNASNKRGVATVNNKNGLVILPDNWLNPSGVVFISEVASNDGSEYYKTINNYTLSEWEKMEAKGAVFLPAAGLRSGTNMRMESSVTGHYWSSSMEHNLYFFSDDVDMGGSVNYSGLSVRLVKDVQ